MAAGTPSAASSRKYALPEPARRARVAAALRAIEGWTERPEQSCAYRLDFAAAGGERVVVKQYTNGTLFLQAAGPPGPLLERLAGAAEAAGAAAAPAAPAAGPAARRGPRGSTTGVDVERPFDPPWIGSDESGKGDYLGPLVAAAVRVDQRILELLATLGVRDSKALSDAQNRRLAQDVRAVCAGGLCAEVLVPPERYNALYRQFRAEGKNLNTLLAWAHARAIETVLERAPAGNVIVDQFADARYIRTRLEAVVRRRALAGLTIVQLPRAEANLAVAAASVLARDGFLAWLERASREAGFDLPKGASPQVEAAARRLVARRGAAALPRFAKLHFKTTERVLPGGGDVALGAVGKGDGDLRDGAIAGGQRGEQL